MSIELQLLTWWLLFGGTHILLSSVPLRARLIPALGLRGFKAVYSLAALATFIPLVVTAWNNRHEGALLYDPPSWTVHVTETVMLLSVLLLALSVATPSPATTVMEMTGRARSQPRGVLRVTRHPNNTGFILFGLAHMISNPTVGDWTFWGGFVIFGVASALHQDRRSLATGPAGFDGFVRQTSFLPFAAILAGRQRLVLRELSRAAMLVGVVFWMALRLLHPHLIGGFS